MSADLDLYQAYLGDAQRRFLAPSAIPYDVSANTANDQREYGLFKAIHAKREAGSGPWGLVSWKFEHKSLVPLDRFHAFASERLAAGDDCVFLNPMIGNAAMHTNVWEQWAVANKAIPHLCDFMGSFGDVDYLRPMGEDSFAFCNYFVATDRFWTAYFAFVDTFIDRLEQEKEARTPIGIFYGGSGNYTRNTDITTKPFIIERLFASFLASDHGLSATPFLHDEATYVAKFGARLGEVLLHLADLKRRGLAGDQAADARWEELRRRLMKEKLAAIWQMDDPSELLLSADFRPSLAGANPR